jgi:glycine/sarcosine N-methyltransferase
MPDLWKMIDFRPHVAYIESMDFYAELAEHYDDMTRFQERVAAETRVLSLWQKKLACRTVVDLGCGSGLHSIALATLGMEVLAIDSSAAMLQRAQENAAARDLPIRFMALTMQKLAKTLQEPIDAVFCLGNTLPHLLSNRALQVGLKSMYQSLRPGGALVLQLLNYDHVLRQQERIVQISRSGELEYVRFYDFLKNKIRFNVLMIDGRSLPYQHRLLSTELYPWTKSQLTPLLKKCGFTALQYYGNLSQSPYESSSPNLVICAVKK